MIVIDDLHWAGEGTLRLLAALRGRLPAIACLVVGTYRDAEIPDHSLLADLAPTGNRIALSGLVPDEVAQLLGDVLDRQPDPATVTEVRRRTGGNPFLVLQVARLLASGSDDALPAGARDVLGRRLGVLPDDVRTVLGAAATLGSPFRAATVAAIVDLDGAAVLDALDHAAAARVAERLQSAGDWSFVHDLFRAAVLDALPTSTAAALHNAAGTVLAEAGAEPAIVAHHLLGRVDGSRSQCRELGHQGVRACTARARLGGSGGPCRTGAGRVARRSVRSGWRYGCRVRHGDGPYPLSAGPRPGPPAGRRPGWRR